MAAGDHLSVSRGLYTHHGIDAGNGKVIHYSGEPFEKSAACVCVTSLVRFADGGQVEVVDSPRAYAGHQVVKRARRRLGEQRYSLVTGNCEHFVRWCRDGEPVSEQVVTSARIAQSVGRVLQLHGMGGGKGLEIIGEFIEQSQPTSPAREPSFLEHLLSSF